MTSFASYGSSVQNIISSPTSPVFSLLTLAHHHLPMIKLWPSSSSSTTTTVDSQLTPRVGKDGRERPNPFELAVATAAHPPSHHHALLHTPVAEHAPSSAGTGPLTPRSPSTTAFASPTTSISIRPPEFHMNQPPTKRPNHMAPPVNPTPLRTSTASTSVLTATAPSRTTPTNGVAAVPASTRKTSPPPENSNRSPIGHITVKLLSARALNVQSSRACPYVVAEFEHNEFVSRDPIPERGPTLKGAPTPAPVERTNSHAAHALGAISFRAKQAEEAAAAKKAAKQPGSTPSSGGSTKSTIASSAAGSSSTSSISTPGTSPGTLFGKPSSHSPTWKHEVTFDVTRQDSKLTLNVYDRASTDNYFLGTVELKPILRHDHTVDQWYKLHGLQDDKNVTGEMRVQVTFTQNKSRRALTTKDFEILKLIGRGTFGRVFQVRKRDTKRIYAMKVLSKREIIAKKEVAHTIGERDILQCSLESPFLVGLKFSFQTEGDLFLVTDFKSGGELFWHLQRETKFTEERARFYVAELVLALEHLHKYNIVYRDLKPENILLDATGHVALCDFGLSKANLQQGQLTQTFCGTTEYLAPEVLLDEHGYSKLVDFWSLGVLLFEMCCGWSPFYAEDTQQMYKNICFGRIRFPRGAIGDDGKQFVKALLNRNPKHRLGATRDAAELKEHPFFAGIDWTALAQRRVEPPFKPTVESDESVECFDTEFTSADVAAFGLDSDHESLDEDDPSEAWTAPTVPMGSHTPNGPLGSDAPYSASSVNGSGFFSPPISRTNTVPTPLSAVIPVAATNSLQGPLSGNSSTTAAATAGLPASHAVAIGAPKRKKEKAAAAGGSPIPGSMFQGFTFSGGESVVVPSDLAARAEAAAAADDDLIVKGPALADEEGANTEDEVDDDSRAAGRYARAAKLDDELEF